MITKPSPSSKSFIPLDSPHCINYYPQYRACFAPYFCGKKAQKGNNMPVSPDLRAGGMGGGNLSVPNHKPPEGWQARVIKSDNAGVQKVVSWVPPETMTGLEFDEQPAAPPADPADAPLA